MEMVFNSEKGPYHTKREALDNCDPDEKIYHDEWLGWYYILKPRRQDL